MRRRNPYVGEFVGTRKLGESAQPKRQFVDMDDLSWEEIRKLPRVAFKDSEWNELKDDEKESIYENDPVSQARVAKLVKLFVEPYKYVEDPDESWIFEVVGDDYFSSWLLEQADHLVEHAEQNGHSDEIEEIVELYTNVGDEGEPAYTKDQVHEAIDKALQDSDNYDRSLSDEYSGAFFKDGRSEEQIDVDDDEVDKALEGMYDDEVDRAAEEIDSETDGVWRPRHHVGRFKKLTGGDIKAGKSHGWSTNVGVSYWVDWEPDWEKIKAAVEELLGEMEPEEPETDEARAEREKRSKRSLEERKVYKFPDGFYWLELVQSELEPEGRRGGDGLYHCIGDPEHGYPQALAKGYARAYSLRAPSGKRKLTLWADLTHSTRHVSRPTIRGISQVKGKMNRLPGWDLHKAGDSRFKEDEVKKTLDFILDYLEFNAYDVPDLGPALRHMQQDPKLGPWLDDYDEEINKKLGIGTVLPRLPVEANQLIAQGRRRRENPPHVCESCGGEAVGFCAPYRPPAENDLGPADNPSSTVLRRRRSELTTAFARRVASHMSEDDEASFLIDEETVVATRCKKHVGTVADPDVMEAEIFWSEKGYCDRCPGGR